MSLDFFARIIHFIHAVLSRAYLCVSWAFLYFLATLVNQTNHPSVVNRPTINSLILSYRMLYYFSVSLVVN